MSISSKLNYPWCRSRRVRRRIERGGALRPVSGGEREARRERCAQEDQGLGHINRRRAIDAEVGVAAGSERDGNGSGEGMDRRRQASLLY